MNHVAVIACVLAFAGNDVSCPATVNSATKTS